MQWIDGGGQWFWGVLSVDILKYLHVSMGVLLHWCKMYVNTNIKVS